VFSLHKMSLASWLRRCFPPETPFLSNIWSQARPMITGSNVTYEMVGEYGEGNRNIDKTNLDINYVQFHIMFILNSLTSYFALLIKWEKLHFTRHYQYWDHYDSLILNQCLSPLKLCVRFPLMARCTLCIFIMFYVIT
jgi:hypothetical protein